MKGYNLPDDVSPNSPDAPWNQEYEEDTNDPQDQLAHSAGPDKPLHGDVLLPGVGEMMMADCSIIAKVLELGLPYLDAEAANREVVRLTIELMRAQAEIDKTKLIRLWDEEDRG